MLKRFLALCLLLLGSSASFAQPGANAVIARCGEVITVDTHDGSTTRYSLARPTQTNSHSKPIALVLLAGGTGYVNLDDAGCPRALRGNSLVRSIPHFRAAGFFTALVDAPSTHQGVDGLEGFRTTRAARRRPRQGHCRRSGPHEGNCLARRYEPRLNFRGKCCVAAFWCGGARGCRSDVAGDCRTERSEKGVGGAIRV